MATIKIGKILYGYCGLGMMWFRICGWGLAIKDTKKIRLLFSERNRLQGKRIGRFHVVLLKPNR